jgi:hypothetical protein
LTDPAGELVKTIYPSHKLKLIDSIPDDDDHFVVERVVDDRGPAGAKEYLIKWKGWPTEDNTCTWEPLSSFDSPIMIEAYWRSKRSNSGDL